MSSEIKEKLMPDKEGVFFLVYNNGQVLLEERLQPEKAYYGYIIIPGGKVEVGNGEDHTAAVKREVREECGVIATNITKLDNFLNMSLSKNFYNTSAYLITEYDGEVRNVEGKSRHIWVDIDKASEVLSFADSRYLILLTKLHLSGIKL
jgi:8-oxo-dGTP pyrophosphatase MutT (NUDIX family)